MLWRVTRDVCRRAGAEVRVRSRTRKQTTMSPRDSQKTVETDVASRLDRLPFSRWHWLIVAGLGVTWIRHWIPESPRWQATHGHNDGAKKTVKAVEDVVFSLFLTFALVLIKFYGVNGERVGLYLVPIAAGNVLSPFLLGPLFDHIGRKPMIAVTYGLAGILLAITGYLFKIGMLSAMSQTFAWSICKGPFHPPSRWPGPG